MDKQPIRCFQGEAKPYEPFWNFKDAIDGKDPELELKGVISEFSWYDDDITPKKFRDDLNRYGQGGPITIRLNSYGGDVIAASQIYSILQDYPGEVTVQIDGIAASAATVVAIAGDHVRMMETAYFMIHDPLAVFFLAMMNIEELTRMTESLKAVKEGIVNAYETKTGLSRTRLSKLMTDETWMDANYAHQLGFVDEVVKGEKKEALFKLPENVALVNALANYKNVPEGLLESLQPSQTEPEIQPTESPELAKFRAEVQLLKG